METIIKYNNRKLYSKSLKKYVNLAYLKDLVKSGQGFQVRTHGVDKDVTSNTLKEMLSLVDIPNNVMLELVKKSR